MFSKESYIARREGLRRLMATEKGIVVLPGNVESPMNYPSNCYHFRQDSTFLYLFGLNLPGLCGVIDLDQGTETIFGDDLSMDDIIWTGPQPSVAELAARAGVNRAQPLKELAATVADAARKGRRVHFLPPYRAKTAIQLAELLNVRLDGLKGGESVELALAVVELRSVKSAEELEQLEDAARIGYAMHAAAMRMCRPGGTEAEIAGEIEGIAMKMGAGTSFASIVSQNGETLHNHSHYQQLAEGRLLLVDAGAENAMNYCSDYTRTLPVGGRFSAMQREIYQIVLDANNLGQKLAAPGRLYRDVHLAAMHAIVDGLKALGLMRGDTQEAVAAGAHALFMPHGLGHMMGLDVHDMENIGEKYVGYDRETQRSTQQGLASLRMGRRLGEGMTMTVEPGIYFIPAYIAKWRAEGRCAEFIDFAALERYADFGGIRIEDNIAITSDGCRLIGKRLPATIAEIEEFMA
ncbi:MAG: aminopeptidase P family protein [Rikenellaceae bacterium]|jgi:Xaa-Pro aminopeptidase|nr:aminopeptidase P family protein [Rikenellaceae bacterium]